MAELKMAAERLIEHVCGQKKFDEDAAYLGLEQAIEFDWQKRLVRLLSRLADAIEKLDGETPA